MSPEELSMVEASSTVEEKYVKANDSIGDRFVDTIKYFGAEPMNDMLKIAMMGYLVLENSIIF